MGTLTLQRWRREGLPLAMAGFTVTLLSVVDVLVAVIIGVSYMDIESVSSYARRELEYMAGTYAGVCTNAAAFGVLCLVGISTFNHKFVATYKFASVIKLFATAGVIMQIWLEEDLCAEAMAVNWRWYSFAGASCGKVRMLLTIPLAVIGFLALLTIIASSKLIGAIKENKSTRAPIVIADDMKDDGAHPSLSPRGREIQQWIDSHEPADALEGDGGGGHNPKTGFFYSGGMV